MNKLKKLELSLMVDFMGVTSSLWGISGEVSNPRSIEDYKLMLARDAKDEGTGKDMLLMDADKEEESVIRLYNHKNKHKNKNKVKIYGNIVFLENKYGSIGEKFRKKLFPHHSFVKILNDLKKKEQLSLQDQPTKNEVDKKCEVILNRSDTNAPSKWRLVYKILKFLVPTIGFIPNILEKCFDYKIKKCDHDEEMAKLGQGPLKYFFYKVSNVGGGLCKLGGKALDATKSIVNNVTGQPGFWGTLRWWKK
jgi:hypothetical protein